MRNADDGDVPRRTQALLQSLGADREFVDEVLGDLAEEYRFRTGLDGARAARWWYRREALRTAPYLLRDWRRGFRPIDVAPVLAGVLGWYVADTISWLALTRVTMWITGIPLGAYIGHWMSTSDQMPWLLIGLPLRRILGAMIGGAIGGLIGKRAPIATALLMTAALFGMSMTRAAIYGPNPRMFLLVLANTALLAPPCVAGGVLAALWLQRRARRRNGADGDVIISADG